MEFDPVSYMMGQKAAGGGGGGSSTLSGLTDVDISNPTNGQTLVYNATSRKWENGAAGSGASLIMPNISITITGEDTVPATCDMTRAAIVSAIENGAICIARITGGTSGQSTYRLTTDVTVFNDDVDNAVAFTAYDQSGSGNVVWYTIIVSDDAVVGYVDRTISYPHNNQ